MQKNWLFTFIFNSRASTFNTYSRLKTDQQEFASEDWWKILVDQFLGKQYGFSGNLIEQMRAIHHVLMLQHFPYMGKGHQFRSSMG